MNPLAYLSMVLAALGAGDRFDSKFTSALERQLEFIKAQTYDIVYPELKARTLIPVDNSVDPGAETITYRQWDEFGAAKVISNFADDLPSVDALVEEFTSPVKSIGASYQWSVQDLRRSAMSGSQLDQRRANAARRSIENKIEDNGAFGLANAGGITGFYNNPNVPITTLITGTWATATADQIIADINKMVTDYLVSTKEAFLPDTLVVPQAAYFILATKRVSTTGDTGTTILKQLLETSPYIKSVVSWTKGTSAGVGSTTRMVLYKRDPEVLQMCIPQEFEQMPPQAQSLAFTVPCHARVAGVIVYYPIAMRYADGI